MFSVPLNDIYEDRQFPWAYTCSKNLIADFSFLFPKNWSSLVTMAVLSGKSAPVYTANKQTLFIGYMQLPLLTIKNLRYYIWLNIKMLFINIAVGGSTAEWYICCVRKKCCKNIKLVKYQNLVTHYNNPPPYCARGDAGAGGGKRRAARPLSASARRGLPYRGLRRVWYCRDLGNFKKFVIRKIYIRYFLSV